MNLAAGELAAVRPSLSSGYARSDVVPRASLGCSRRVVIGGAASIGWMTVVNFLINSDFKWVLLGMVLLWAASLPLGKGRSAFLIAGGGGVIR